LIAKETDGERSEGGEREDDDESSNDDVGDVIGGAGVPLV
jgi:hypothetical protein